MSMEGQTRFVEFMRMDPLQFNRDPIIDDYVFFVGFHKRLHGFRLVGSNRVNFTAF